VYATSENDQNWLLGFVWELAKTQPGTRILQAVVENCSNASQKIVLSALRGNVWNACRDKWANFLLSKCMERTPSQSWQGFVIEELTKERNLFVAVAEERAGCRVLEQLIDHLPMKDLKQLLEEVLHEVSGKGRPKLRGLIQHDFGNFVVQHLIEQDDEGKVQELVVGELCRCDDLVSIHELTLDKKASWVVDKALIYCKPWLYAKLVEALLKPNEARYWKRQYSSFVCKHLSESLNQSLKEDGSHQARREKVLPVLRNHQDRLGGLKLDDATYEALKNAGVVVQKKEASGRGECKSPEAKCKKAAKKVSSKQSAKKKAMNTTTAVLSHGDQASREDWLRGECFFHRDLSSTQSKHTNSATARPAGYVLQASDQIYQ
jgi:hypothetical protein